MLLYRTKNETESCRGFSILAKITRLAVSGDKIQTHWNLVLKFALLIKAWCMVLFLKDLSWARLMLLGSFNNLENLKQKQNGNSSFLRCLYQHCQGVVAEFLPHYFQESLKQSELYIQLKGNLAQFILGFLIPKPIKISLEHQQ